MPGPREIASTFARFLMIICINCFSWARSVSRAKDLAALQIPHRGFRVGGPLFSFFLSPPVKVGGGGATPL